jgi:hypothetical protein
MFEGTKYTDDACAQNDEQKCHNKVIFACTELVHAKRQQRQRRFTTEKLGSIGQIINQFYLPVPHMDSRLSLRTVEPSSDGGLFLVNQE